MYRRRRVASPYHTKGESSPLFCIFECGIVIHVCVCSSVCCDCCVVVVSLLAKFLEQAKKITTHIIIHIECTEKMPEEDEKEYIYYDW